MTMVKLTPEQLDLLTAITLSPQSEAAFSGMIANQLTQFIADKGLYAEADKAIRRSIAIELIEQALNIRLLMREAVNNKGVLA